VLRPGNPGHGGNRMATAYRQSGLVDQGASSPGRGFPAAVRRTEQTGDTQTEWMGNTLRSLAPIRGQPARTAGPRHRIETRQTGAGGDQQLATRELSE